ncbi:MAG: hypothetical protein PS018_26495 [bacterium]|nr:hypothetical protein [bacterium]
MTHDPELLRAAAALGDRLVPPSIRERLDEIERVLKFDSDIDARRMAERDLMELTNRKDAA